MKICLISGLYPPYAPGGAEIYVKNIVDYFDDKNYNVIVITTDPSSKKPGSIVIESIKNIKVYRINPINAYNMYYVYTTNTIIKFGSVNYMHLIFA